LEYEKIAFALGNPLTAIGFVETAKAHGVTAIVQDGASSAIGKIIIRLCKREGVKTINIVRKEEYIANLTSQGADYVINSSVPNWDKEVERLAHELDARVCFECVGGNVTGRVLSALPDKSVLYHYGNLELKRLREINNADFVFRQKKMKGWWLMRFILGLNEEKKKHIAEDIATDIKNGNHVFGTTLSKTFKLEEFEKAFEFYLTNMGEGKILMKPHDS
jgi:NADPH:quinone reductase-like Zn-dependent oxidoreductase